MADNFVATENGNIKISPEVIVRISAISAREVQGVAGLGTSSGFAEFLGKVNPEKGIKVELADDSAVVDVHVTVKFGVKIQEVAYNLQQTVKNAIESFAGLENITVNVFVDGIEQEKPADKKEEK